VRETPAQRATKAEWVEYAVALGIPADTAEAATKVALQGRVEELVAAAESRGPVGSDVELVDDGTEPEQVVTGPVVDGPAVGEDSDGDGQVVGHDGGA